MTALATLYASAPADEILVIALEIKSETGAPLRVCTGDEEIAATLETDEVVTFYPRGIDVALPGVDASGNQRLTFAIENVTEFAQTYVEAAIEADEGVMITLRKYVLSDLTTLLEAPLVMPCAGGGIKDGQFQAQARVNDWLNRGWPRTRYTAEFAPGLRYA